MRAIVPLLLLLFPQTAALAEPAAEVDPGYDLVVFGEIVPTDDDPAPPRAPDADRLPPGFADALDVARTLAPDLLVTTGNQFAGPESTAQWREQQTRFTDAMNALAVPWVGVKGASERVGAPAVGHAAFIDALSPGVETRDLGFALVVMLDTNTTPDPSVTRAQIEQLGDRLAHSGARQVLVFMHDALWLTAGWDDLRAVLAADGRPAAVFASSPRVWRDDAVDANIHLYTLGPVFGDDGQPFSDAYAWPHLTLIHVRPSGVTPVIIPLHDRKGRAGVLPATWQTGADVDLARALARGDWLGVSGEVPAAPGAELRGSFRVRVTNPTDQDLPYRVGVSNTRGSTVSPREIAGTLAPHESADTDFEIQGDHPDAARPRDAVRAAIDFAMPNGQVQTIIARAPVPARLELPSGAGEPATDPAQNGVLDLRDGAGLEADLPALPTFTLECWVKPDGARTGAALAGTLTPDAGFGLVWSKQTDGSPCPVGVVYVGGHAIALPTVGVWDWDRWAHLALSFDGHTARLFVNGKLHQAIALEHALDLSGAPLAIGTTPLPDERAGSAFTGRIDEVRVRTAAQSEPFTPERVLSPTPDTVVLYHFDHAGAPGADASGHANHAWSIGSPEAVTDPIR